MATCFGQKQDKSYEEKENQMIEDDFNELSDRDLLCLLAVGSSDEPMKITRLIHAMRWYEQVFLDENNEDNPFGK